VGDGRVTIGGEGGGGGYISCMYMIIVSYIFFFPHSLSLLCVCRRLRWSSVHRQSGHDRYEKG
jgi:hypothetical protein